MEEDPTQEEYRASWIEWRRRCALARCSQETGSRLRALARSRFDLYCRRYSPAPALQGDHPLLPRSEDCWHLFETHLAVDATRQGKRYKKWLAERVRQTPGHPLAVWTGGATVLMRDVVRAYLARECPHPRSISLNGPDGEREEILIRDLARAEATPADAAMDREFDRLARREADTIWPELGRPERTAFVVRELGLGFRDPEVRRICGREKTALHAEYRQAVERIVFRIQRAYSGEDPDAILLLTRRVIRAVAERTLQWIQRKGNGFPAAWRRQTPQPDGTPVLTESIS